MKDLIDRLLGILPGDMGEKGAKFLAVTAFNVIFGQSLLAIGQVVFGWDPLPSNVFAVSVSSVPAYIFSRYWVWQKTTKNLFWKEIFPFWALAFLGLVVSTAAVWVVESNWEDVPAIAVNLTNLVAFGILWIAKFFILDRILFVHVPHAHDDEDTGDPTTVVAEDGVTGV